MVRNPVEDRKTFGSELLFSLMPLLLRLGRGKLASGQWPVRIPKFTQPRHVRVGVEIHYLTWASGFKGFSPILFMHMLRGHGRSISGGAHIHIFVLCIINFFWNRLFLQSVNTNIWICAPPRIDLPRPPNLCIGHLAFSMSNQDTIHIYVWPFLSTKASAMSLAIVISFQQHIDWVYQRKEWA